MVSTSDADSLPVVAWVARTDGAVERYNRAWWEGASPDATGDEPWTARVHPEDRTRCEDAWRRSLETSTPFQAEYRFQDTRHDGYRWHVGHIHPIRSPDGEVTGWSGTSTDVHDLACSRQALLDADRRKDDFLAVLGHELRNPLAAMVSAVELLGAAPEPDVAARAHAVLQRQLTQLNRLVDDLLEVTRVARGRIELSKEPIRLDEVIDDAVAGIRPAVHARMQHLRVKHAPTPVEVYADPARLEQLLSNLLTNAVKYTERGGRIGVTVTAEGDTAIVRVEDDGVGIEPDLLPVIFEPFTQARGTLDRSDGGLGLGLALVRQLAELHGGSITAESEGLGKGSSFTLRLPVRTQEPALSQPPAAPAESPKDDGDHGRVLVVDDNEDAALGLSIILKRWGFDVRTAHDGETALSVAESFLPSKVVLDIGLPRMNGWDVAKRLRENPRTRGALLIALTGYGSPDDRRRSLESGFDHHLVKPADAADLRRLLVG